MQWLAALCGAAGLLRVLPAAAWNAEAFGATAQPEALRAAFGEAAITESDAIRIDTHDVVENGAYVPLQIESSLPAIDQVSILVEQNPNPLIAQFELAPRCRPFIATRIKVGAPSRISVVVRSDGRLFAAHRFVEVVEGGCN